MDNQKGAALLIAMVAAVILTLLGLSLALTSSQEFEVSNQFESHEQAIAIADGAFNQVKNELRGQSLNTVLSQEREQQVPMFASYDSGIMLAAAGTYASRNPITPLEARSIDFSTTPSTYGTRAANGLLTNPMGEMFGTGRYFAKLSDNDDGDDDPYTDSDNRVMLRVIGIHQGLAQNAFSHGTNRKNSVAIVEAELRQYFNFDFSSPFSVYGPNANPSRNAFFDGNSFYIDGYDHRDWDSADVTRSHNHNSGDEGGTAISAIYDDPGFDAIATANTIHADLNSNQYDNLEGHAGLFGSSPSIGDDTDFYRNHENEDLQNLFDIWFMLNFVMRATSVADVLYEGDTSLSGNGISLGTADEPMVVVVNGDLDLSGGGSGAGLLVVTGKLDYSGSFDYQGMILVVGEGEADFGGANKSVIGGLYVARIEDNGGTPSFGEPSFTLGGNSNFYYSSSLIDMANTLLPLTTVSWREITPDIEPVE